MELSADGHLSLNQLGREAGAVHHCVGGVTYCPDHPSVQLRRASDEVEALGVVELGSSLDGVSFGDELPPRKGRQRSRVLGELGEQVRLT
jgi:hypothetical protein